MLFKIPTIFTTVCVILYFIIFLFITSHSNSGIITDILIFLGTMPLLAIFVFAVSAAFCIILCKKYDEDIEECQHSIKKSVDSIVYKLKVKNAKHVNYVKRRN